MDGSQKNQIKIAKNLLGGHTCRNCRWAETNFVLGENDIEAKLVSCEKDLTISDTCERWEKYDGHI